MAIEEAQINQGLLDAALEISARRADTLRQVRQLFIDGQDRKAVDLMKKFLGLGEANPLIQNLCGSRVPRRRKASDGRRKTN